MSLSAIALCFSISHGVSAAPDKSTTIEIKTYSHLASYTEFKPALEIVMNKLIRSYQKSVDKPLVINIIDSDNESASYLIGSVTNKAVYDPSISLGLHFERDIFVNGVASAACVLQYRPKGVTNLVKNYEKSEIFSRKEILHYIAAHEVGHCLAYHQASIGQFKTLSIKEHELFADKFAIAFFYANNQKESAKRVIEFNHKHSHLETHYHPEQLTSFVGYLDILFKNHAPMDLIKSALDIFYLASDQGEKI